MDNSLLEVRDLNKFYNSFQINNLNLKLNAGEIVGFIGRNGAGKSTTIKSILNVIDIDSGEVILNGKNIKSHEVESKSQIGYVGENTRFYNDITLNLLYKFVKESYKNNWDDVYFKNLVNNVFKLNMNKKIKELSKGMIVKYMLAISLSHKPKLLILDEPTSGLDPIIRQEVLEILWNLNRKNNTTIFMSSHISEDIESICERIIFIDAGKILLDIKIKDALERYKKFRIDRLNNEQKNIFKKFSVVDKEFYIFNINDSDGSIGSDLLQEVSLNEILLYLNNKNCREVKND